MSNSLKFNTILRLYSLTLCKKILRRYCPDKWVLDVLFYRHFYRFIDWKDSQSFNEKLSYLKLYDRNPLYTRLVDKYEVKEWVANMIGDEYIIPTLGIYDSVEEINFDELPNQFVLKCTHDSGGVVICKNKQDLDIVETKKILKRRLKKNYYYRFREYPYKNVKPRIIAEEYMEEKAGNSELKDYKFFCFGGEAKYLYIASDRYSQNEETKFDFFDIDFNLLPFTNGYPNSNKPIPKPVSYEQMIAFAEKLSHGIPHVRIDFYNINGNIYFGEMTFSHMGGVMPFHPQEWDYIFGKNINIAQSWNAALA